MNLLIGSPTTWPSARPRRRRRARRLATTMAAGKGSTLTTLSGSCVNGPDPGTDRSREFFRIVGSYLGRGRDADWITEHIGQYPDGIGAKLYRAGPAC